MFEVINQKPGDLDLYCLQKHDIGYEGRAMFDVIDQKPADLDLYCLQKHDIG